MLQRGGDLDNPQCWITFARCAARTRLNRGRAGCSTHREHVARLSALALLPDDARRDELPKRVAPFGVVELGLLEQSGPAEGLLGALEGGQELLRRAGEAGHQRFGGG